jgi:hypothetical protein
MKKYKLKNIDCPSIASRIEDPLTNLDEVRFVNVSFAKYNNYRVRNKKILKQLNIIAFSHNGKCLSWHYYENIRQKLLWECRKGHKWFASVNSFLYSGSWCPYCAGNRKLSLTELQQLAVQKGGRCLATQYTNSKTKLFWQCNKGHQWQATAFSIKIRESWCPVCYKFNLKTSKNKCHENNKLDQSLLKS